jgi:hypothetical protein
MRSTRLTRTRQPGLNNSIQRMGASLLAHFHFGSAWRLAPTADAGRYAS